MKGKWNKFLSMLLVLSFVVSVGAVFTSTEATVYADDSEQADESLKLIYYRTYDEGWYLSNGLSVTAKNNTFAIDSEVGLDYK